MLVGMVLPAGHAGAKPDLPKHRRDLDETRARARRGVPSRQGIPYSHFEIRSSKFLVNVKSMAHRGLPAPKNATNLFEAGAPPASLHLCAHANEMIEGALAPVHQVHANPEWECARQAQEGTGSRSLDPLAPSEGPDQQHDDEGLPHDHPHRDLQQPTRQLLSVPFPDGRRFTCT